MDLSGFSHTVPRVGSLEDRDRVVFIEIFKKYYLLIGSSAAIGFSILDWFYSPEYFWNFLAFRAAAIPVSLISWQAYRFDFISLRHFTWPVYFAGVYLGLLHWYLIANSGNEASPHIGGLLLSTIFLVGNLPWTTRQVALLIMVMWSPFLAHMATIDTSVSGPLLLATAFLFGLALYCSWTFHLIMRRYRVSEYESLLRLEKVTIEQAEIIKQKTQEGIYLEKLATQFSPQIIDSIKSGHMDLDTKMRRFVAVIFIDVANSTQRTTRIDPANYSSLMAEFFGDCVKLLLKNNVTIGTYQGDGIMAITNAPSENVDFRKNALMACLEILARHEKMKEVYFQKWRTNFDIRIGIESGWATVGFFPSRQHGTYTALGGATNLAARLCSRADMNSIAVTRDFLNQVSLPDNTIRIEKMRQMSDLKGLEGETFEIYSVKPAVIAEISPNNCPGCDVPMEVIGTQVGAEFLQCPRCRHRMILSAPKSDIA